MVILIAFCRKKLEPDFSILSFKINSDDELSWWKPAWNLMEVIPGKLQGKQMTICESYYIEGWVSVVRSPNLGLISIEREKVHYLFEASNPRVESLTTSFNKRLRIVSNWLYQFIVSIFIMKDCRFLYFERLEIESLTFQLLDRPV